MRIRHVNFGPRPVHVVLGGSLLRESNIKATTLGRVLSKWFSEPPRYVGLS